MRNSITQRITTTLLFLLFCFISSSSFPADKDLSSSDKTSIEKEFCMKWENNDIYVYTLTNKNGCTAKFTNYGALVLSLKVPDKNGKFDDVTLGFDSVATYIRYNPHFGSAIGRFSNRIANAQFTLDGITYHLTVNSRNKHSIHGGVIGFDKIAWNADTVTTKDGPAVKLTHLSPDGHEGFPGNLNVTIMYTLTNDNALRIDYYAETDKPTVINFTNHSFFNIAGEGNGNVLDQQIMINADKYTPTDNESMPTGEIKDVAGTPYDFREMRAVGSQMDQLPRGYDMNYVLNHPPDELGLCAKVYDPVSGRVMEAYTTEPGVQFFTGNGMRNVAGKNGHVYNGSYGLCLETEHFPNSPNEPDFPSTVLRPGEKFHSVTIYKFSLK